MISWDKPLDRKTFGTFEVPKHIRDITNFKDFKFSGKKYFFKLSAGNFSCAQYFKMTSGLEVYIPEDLQKKLKAASIKSTHLKFDWDESKSLIGDFNDKISKSLKDTSSTRQKRLKKAKKIPTTKLVSTIVYNRNSDVVAEVILRAKGHCESCKKPAPFLRRTDKTPYLEVHHIIRLADGGNDTVDNAEALCPNCHREKHYG